MSIVGKRSELIFCYDIKDANPNGDPLDSNKPRIDEETGEEYPFYECQKGNDTSLDYECNDFERYCNERKNQDNI